MDNYKIFIDNKITPYFEKKWYEIKLTESTFHSIINTLKEYYNE